MKRYIPYLAGIIYSSIFGFSFLFTKTGLEYVETFHLLAFRFTFAAISLTILFLLKIIKINYRNKGKDIFLLFLLSILEPCLYFIFETTGLTLSTSSEAGVIIALIPVFVTILAAVFLKEKPTLLQSFFIILSVSGVILISLMKGTKGNWGNFSGIFYLLGAVVIASTFNILSRKLSVKYTPIEITFLMMWSGAIFFNILSLYKNKYDLWGFLSPITNSKVLLSVSYLGLLSSVLAFFLMNYTLSRIEAAQAAVFAYFSTVVSILAGIFIRGEEFYCYQVLGGILIILGVWGTNYFNKKGKKVKENKGAISF